MRLPSLPIVVVCLLAGGAPTAAAAPGVVSPDADPARGPAVAGENIVWTEFSDDGYDLWLGSDGKDPVSLARIFTRPTQEELDDPGGTTSYFAGGLAADGPSSFAFGTSSVFDKVRAFTDTIYAGPIGSEVDPYIITTGDEFNGPACSRVDTGDFDIDGETLAYAIRTQPGCNPAVESLHLRGPDRASDVKLDAGAASSVSSPRIAGQYVAWQQTVAGLAEVVLWDRPAGKVVLRVPGAPASFDVEAGGKLVIAADDGTLSWRIAGDDTAHTLVPTGVTRVIAGPGRAGYQRAGTSGSVEIGSIALEDGATPVPVAAIPANLEPRWGYDGNRIAWLDETCTQTPLRTRLAPTTPGPTDDSSGFAPSCPVEIGSKLAVSSRTGRATVRLTCPQGCSGRLSLIAPKLFRGARKAFFVGKPGKTAKVVVELTAAGLRKLERRRSAPGTITARSLLRGGGRTYSRSVKLKLG